MNLFLEKNYFIGICENQDIIIIHIEKYKNTAAYFEYNKFSKTYKIILNNSSDPKIIDFINALNINGISQFHEEMKDCAKNLNQNTDKNTIDFIKEVYQNIPQTEWKKASIIIDCFYAMNQHFFKVYCFEKHIKILDLKQSLIDLLHPYQLLYAIDKNTAIDFLSSKMNLKNPNHHQLKT